MSSFDGARVMITGGLGFIGSNLARSLVERGAEVTLVDSLIPEYGGNFQNIADIESRVKVNIGDVRDEYSMNHLVRGLDFLFNLAGQTSHVDSMSDPYADLSINARAQLSILEACRKHNRDIRIVFASTRQIYGRPQYLPVDEAHPLKAVDVNGINKLAGEQYHVLYCEIYGIAACCLRLTNTYGPAMRVKDARQTFVGIWVKNLLTGQPIKVFGDGSQLRDFTFVDDCVTAFLAAATNPRAAGMIMNVGGPDRISLADLAQLMIRCNGAGSMEIVPFPGETKAIDIGDYYADDLLARETLGWEPRVRLEQGIARTLEYYRHHGEHYFT
jgi:UDP-glucose 4-epimerase